MLEQSDIDTLLASATDLAAETSNQIGAPAGSTAVSQAGAAASSPATAVAIDRSELQRILNMRFPVIVTLAQRTMPLKNILNLTAGSIIEFDRAADAELDLVVGNRHIGTGQAVKVGEYFGLRITTAGPIEERIRALGQ